MISDGLRQPQNDPVHHAGADAVGQHRPGHGEQLGPGAGDKALWLCQDRHTNFLEIYLSGLQIRRPLIILACPYKSKPARSAHINLNLS